MGDASDLVYRLELTHEGGPERYAGSELDVRSVVARIPQDVKDELRFDQIPWGRFAHSFGSGEDVPEYLSRLGSEDIEAVGKALSILGDCICHQCATSPPAALAVPFLVRIARSPTAHWRAEILGLVGRAGRCAHDGDEMRAGLLQITGRDDRLCYDVAGYLENWSVQAARIAITSDAPLLVALLDDADAAVRSSACYALATALDGTESILSALHRRLGVERVPAARMSLILAIAQLARVHGDEPTMTNLRQWWADPDRPTDVRVSAALAWRYMGGDPVPDDLRSLLTTAVTDELAESLADVPWMKDVEFRAGTGLRRSVRLALDLEGDRQERL
ncbi:HEAT repeat domain-containing protein [Actinomadura sp. 7K507]|uniref:HEAT repeat domain-containing protein n=1 Tax=Actinomadura sp. 7K507 TaxID=2530365 RepID=UPI001404B407|nr:HEAT repeat domain-containing protein [Actinomadura sp. 7K507]